MVIESISNTHMMQLVGLTGSTGFGIFCNSRRGSIVFILLRVQNPGEESGKLPKFPRPPVIGSPKSDSAYSSANEAPSRVPTISYSILNCA